jgi:hypothetical protein
MSEGLRKIQISSLPGGESESEGDERKVGPK